MGDVRAGWGIGARCRAIGIIDLYGILPLRRRRSVRRALVVGGLLEPRFSRIKC